MKVFTLICPGPGSNLGSYINIGGSLSCSAKIKPKTLPAKHLSPQVWFLLLIWGEQVHVTSAYLIQHKLTVCLLLVGLEVCVMSRTDGGCRSPYQSHMMSGHSDSRPLLKGCLPLVISSLWRGALRLKYPVPRQRPLRRCKSRWRVLPHRFLLLTAEG